MGALIDLESPLLGRTVVSSCERDRISEWVHAASLECALLAAAVRLVAVLGVRDPARSAPVYCVRYWPTVPARKLTETHGMERKTSSPLGLAIRPRDCRIATLLRPTNVTRREDGRAIQKVAPRVGAAFDGIDDGGQMRVCVARIQLRKLCMPVVRLVEFGVWDFNTRIRLIHERCEIWVFVRKLQRFGFVSDRQEPFTFDIKCAQDSPFYSRNDKLGVLEVAFRANGEEMAIG